MWKSTRADADKFLSGQHKHGDVVKFQFKLPLVALRASTPIYLAIGASGANAHAFGGRYDLPLPLWLNLAGAGATVALSFVWVARFARPGVTPPADRRNSDSPADSDGQRPHSLVAGLCVLVFVGLVLAGLFGSQNDPFTNILPVSVWIIWWVGLAYVSALIGDLWHYINPLPIIGRYGGALWMQFAGRRLVAKAPIPARIGQWPAVAAFLLFGWAELIWQSGSVPRNLAFAILAYSSVLWIGMARFGVAAWTEQADCFSRFFHMFSRFAPFDLRARRYRGFGKGLLAGIEGGRSAVAFIMVALAIVAFDGIRETPLWLSVRVGALNIYHTGGYDWLFSKEIADRLIHTTGLFSLPVLFYAIFALTCRLMAMTANAALITDAKLPGSIAGNPSPLDLMQRFAPALVPIAIAYHLAHYATYLLIWGQSIIPLVSDPLGFGWNLFGTAGYQPDIAIVGARFAWITSVIAIVAGHIAAITIGHRVALQVFIEPRRALRSQLPMLILMIAYTMLSLWILAQPIVEF